MLNKIQGRPLWYKIWACTAAIVAVYVLMKVFVTNFELTSFDYLLMVFTHASILIDLYCFPESRRDQHS